MIQAPANLQATVVSGTEVALTWEPVATAITYFINQDGVNVAVAVNAFANITGLTPGTEYSFFVVAEGFDGTESILSPPSNTVTVTTSEGSGSGDPPASLAAPGIISAEQTALGEATITWGAVTDAEAYEARVDGGAPLDVGNALGSTTTGLTAGDHTFEVRAYAGAGPDVFSPWSLLVTVAISDLGAPAPEATVLSSGAIEVTWPAVPPAERYQVRVDGDTIFNVGSLLTFTDTGLAPLQTRTYEVRGTIVDPALTGPWSAPISATTNRSVTFEIIGRLRRLSAYLSDRHITARSINAEFNNIYALLNGGTLVENAPVEAPGPEPDPEPTPAAELAVTPAGLTFATRTIGTTSPSQTVTVSNPGAVATAVGSVTVTSPEFLLATDGCSGVTLAAGETCAINVQFSPTATGLRLAELRVPSSAPDSPDTVSLTGTGEGTDPPPDPDPPPPPPPEGSVAVTGDNDPTSTTHTINLPASTAGDLLLLIGLRSTFGSLSGRAGWQGHAAQGVFSGGATVAQLGYWSRVAGAAEGSSTSFLGDTGGSASNAAFAVINAGPAFDPQSNPNEIANSSVSGVVWPRQEFAGADSDFPLGVRTLLVQVQAFAGTGGADTPGVVSDFAFPDLSSTPFIVNSVPEGASARRFNLLFVYGVRTLSTGDGAGHVVYSEAGFFHSSTRRVFGIQVA